MQLIINGLYADVPRETSLTLEKKSSLLDVADVVCDRSSVFTLPKTAQNYQIFGDVWSENNIGEGARIYYDALCIFNSLAIRGKLAVTAVKKESLDVTFLFGANEKIIDVNNLGTIDEILKEDALLSCTYGVEDRGVNADFATYRYVLDDADKDVLHPSVRVGALLDYFNRKFDFCDLRLPDGATSVANYRILIKEAKPLSARNFVLTMQGSPSNWASEAQPARTINTYNASNATIQNLYVGVDFKSVVGYLADVRQGSTSTMKGLVRHFVAKSDIFVTFTTISASRPLKIGYFDDDSERVQIQQSDFTTLYNNIQPNVAYSIKKGQRFCIIRDNDYKAYQGGTDYRSGWFGIAETFLPTYGGILLYATFRGGSSVNVGDSICLADCLPEMKFIDLCKDIAQASGRYLQFDRYGKLKFFDYNGLQNLLNDSDLSARIDLDAFLVKKSAIKRCASEWGQKNVIKFGNQNVNYNVNNVSLQENYTIYETKLKRGTTSKNARGNIFSTELKNSDVGVLCNYLYQSGYTTMISCYIEELQFLQEIADKSTQVEISVFMPVFVFNQIRGVTACWFSNRRWVVNSAKWNNGIAQLNLQLIS